MINKEQINSWKLFRQMALIGSAELLEKIAPVNELDTTYSSYTESNARNYFLLKILIEVQKAGFTIDRWIKHVESSVKEINNQKRNNIIEMQLESLIDEQSVWQRKLLEALIALICFSESNHNSYYLHYLLLKDLEHYQALRKEQRDFFNEENKYRENAIKILRGKIKIAEQSINDMSRCWYLHNKKIDSMHKDSSQLTSVRQTLMKALRIARPREKTSMGYTYEASFAETSRNIHFNPLRPDFDDALRRFKFGVAQCGSLIISILCRSQQLSGLVPTGLNKLINRIETNRISNTNPTEGIAEIGDFVLAGGLYLAEVLEIKKNIFGYESYRIKYLDERPVKEISEDWLPAFNVQIYLSYKSFIESVNKDLKNYQKKYSMEPVTFFNEEIKEVSRDAVITAWKLGIKNYLIRTLKDRVAKSANKKW